VREAPWRARTAGVPGARGAPGAWLRYGLRLAGAGLLVATAAVHLDLYLTGYRTIPTIGLLFLLQVIAGFLLAGLVLVTRHWLVAAAGAGFALSTLGGYLLAVQFGLFGFREVRTPTGVVAGLIEVGAFGVLGTLALLDGSPVSTHGAHCRKAAGVRGRGGLLGGQLGRQLGGQLGGTRGACVALAGACAVVLAVFGGVLAGSGAGSVASSGGGTSAGPTAAAASTLRTEKIGGTVVLANARGMTLYWFAPDTSTRSACYGSCASYWPPVPGPARAGTGVTGTLGTIRRVGGALQATYDGHPLYTYISDTHPGEATGNGIDINGGVWHEVVVSSGQTTSSTGSSGGGW
jgi:predicted lipoprotein with Yx(FWY)xxD motif